MVMNNKRGQVVFVTLMIAMVVIVLALAFAFPVKEATTNARSSMDCGNTSISNFNKAGCLASDLTLFYVIGGMIFIAGVVMTARIVFK
jgi:uncharacterized protein (UPF0333 family)